MVKTVLLILLLVFAVSGVSDFIYIIKMFFFFPKKRFNYYTFVVLETGDAIKQLTFLWQKICWNGDSFAHGIIAVTDNLDTKEKIICGEYIRDKNILLCPSSCISEIINLQGEYFNG